MTEGTLSPSYRDNKPPPEAEAIFSDLSVRVGDLIKNANRWANERGEITSIDEEEAANDFVAQLRKLGGTKGLLPTAMKAEKAKATAELREISDRFSPLTSAIAIAVTLMKEMLNPWAEKKELAAAEEKLAAESVAREARARAAQAIEEARSQKGDVVGNTMRAEHAQQEAERLEKAAARVETKAKIGSALGGRAMSLRSRWVVKIDDATKIPVRHLRGLCAFDYVQEALQRAVKEIGVDKFDGVPGITIHEERNVA